MNHQLPDRFRPKGLNYRKLNPGVDLPAWFVDGIKSVDHNLYFVYHPYRVMYDDIMNQYSGSADDPRFVIGPYGADEIWGWVLTDSEGNPVPECRWHCWRLGEVGWSHIFDIKYTDPTYLKTLLNRLGVQKVITERYGLKAYIKYMREERERLDLEDQEREAQLFNDVQNANRWLMNTAMDNFKSGKVAPTRPQKDVIASYPGQKNRTKITRDITDTEGGLILPDEWKKE